jgi:hypothetical protein
MGQYQQDSTSESEEVDSDSGYSSPLHRRNLASSGTHPILGVSMHEAQSQPQAFTSLGYNTYTIAGPVTAHTLGPQRPPPYAVYPMPPPPPPLLMAAGPGAVGGAYLSKPPMPHMPLPPPPPPVSNNPKPLPPPPVVAPVQDHARSRSLTKEPSSKTDNETEDSSSLGGKKKRRHRSRHRRRNKDSGGEDDVGALSDDPSHSLHRSHSSSNVSRTSTLDNDILHFEDEDEFPNLLNAANGLVDKYANPSQALSYSDILKTQMVSTCFWPSIYSTLIVL